MTVAPRKKTEIANRRQLVAERYLRGMYQADIADELGVDVSTVSRDLSELRKEWLDRSINHIQQKKAVELAKIDQLEVTYWDAWERSKENAEVEVIEQIGNRRKVKSDDKDAEELAIVPERVKKFKRSEGQSGNPAFLAGVQWCISKRCEILGLEAPKRTEVTGKDGGPVTVRTFDLSKLTDAELEALEEMRRKMQ